MEPSIVVNQHIDISALALTWYTGEIQMPPDPCEVLAVGVTLRQSSTLPDSGSATFVIAGRESDIPNENYVPWARSIWHVNGPQFRTYDGGGSWNSLDYTVPCQERLFIPPTKTVVQGRQFWGAWSATGVGDMWVLRVFLRQLARLTEQEKAAIDARGVAVYPLVK